MLVIIDTNFLLLPKTKKIDIFQEIRSAANCKIAYIILDSVVKELNKLKTDKNLKINKRVAAKVALELLKQKNLKIEQGSNEHTDDAILKKALELKKSGEKIAIATQDKNLISRALNQEIQIFALRQKKQILLLK
jgi:rRNA-processing protein FCF1